MRSQGRYKDRKPLYIQKILARLARGNATYDDLAKALNLSSTVFSNTTTIAYKALYKLEKEGRVQIKAQGRKHIICLVQRQPATYTQGDIQAALELLIDAVKAEAVKRSTQDLTTVKSQINTLQHQVNAQKVAIDGYVKRIKELEQKRENPLLKRLFNIQPQSL